MSRAFTSEEYEVPDMPVIDVKTESVSEDHDLVSSYSAGRSVTDPALPFEIGMNFLKGENGFFKSIDFAVKWLKRSADLGHVQAAVELAKIYLSDTKKYGYKETAQLLRMASENGSEEATSMLDMGSIADVKTKSAFVKYRLNAELGNTDAMIALAEGFEKEYYAKQKWKTAAMWYLRACARGAESARPRLEELVKAKNIELTEDEKKLLKRY